MHILILILAPILWAINNVTIYRTLPIPFIILEIGIHETLV